MKRLIYLLAIISLSACNSKSSSIESAHTSTPNQLPVAQNAPIATTEQQNNPTRLLTNPAHGQPGHDCAIPVGAPLKQNINNQQPTSAPVVTTQSTIQPTAMQTTAQQPAGGQKLNPAHGQPGHKCEIPLAQL